MPFLTILVVIFLLYFFLYQSKITYPWVAVVVVVFSTGRRHFVAYCESFSVLFGILTQVSLTCDIQPVILVVLQYLNDKALH